jgi:hypothetical protein
MDFNYKELDQARAAARLEHNIKRLDRHKDKSAFMDVAGKNIYVRIDFGNDIPIEETFQAEKVSEIEAFCRFLEGSKESDIDASSNLMGVGVMV